MEVPLGASFEQEPVGAALAAEEMELEVLPDVVALAEEDVAGALLLEDGLALLELLVGAALDDEDAEEVEAALAELLDGFALEVLTLAALLEDDLPDGLALDEELAEVLAGADALVDGFTLEEEMDEAAALDEELLDGFDLEGELEAAALLVV